MWGMTEVGAEPDNVGLQFLSGNADVANAHNYVQGNGSAGTTPIDNQAWYAESVARSGPYAGLWDVYGEYWGNTWNKGFAGASTGQNDRPKVTTETGWPTQGNGAITADQQGKLITNLYLTATALGWQHTFVYLLFSEPNAGNGGYGFFNINGDEGDSGNATLMGTYTHNMTAILHDTSSAFTAGTVNYSIPSEPATVHDFLMQKSTGTYELAVWDDRPDGEGSDSVTVNLGSLFATVKVYDITSGTTPIQTLSNVSSLPLTLSDHALIIEMK